MDHAPAQPDEAASGPPGPLVEADAAEPVAPVDAVKPVAVIEPAEATAAVEPVPVDEVEESDPPTTDERRRRTGQVPGLLWAVLVGLVLVALATSLLATDAIADRNRERADRQQVEEVAGRLATALSTYDYRDFEATKSRVLSMSTGAFSTEYERAVAALASLIDQTKAVSEATAGDVFVGNLDDGKASAIVVLEIRASGIGGPRVSVDNYVDLSLVKVEGSWKVDGVRNLNLGVSGGGSAAPTAGRPTAPETTSAAPPRSIP